MKKTISGVSQRVDAYFGVRLPSGALLVMDSRRRFQSDLVPAASGVDAGAGPGGQVSIPVPAGAPPGAYTFMAVCVPAGSSPLNAANHLGGGIDDVAITINLPAP